MDYQDFKYEYIIGHKVDENPMFPLIMSYIFTHQFTLGEYFVTFDDVVNLFKSLFDEKDEILWNDKNKIIICLELPVTKNDLDTVKTILHYLCSDVSDVFVDGHYISFEIKELFNVNKDEYFK